MGGRQPITHDRKTLAGSDRGAEHAVDPEGAPEILEKFGLFQVCMGYHGRVGENDSDRSGLRPGEAGIDGSVVPPIAIDITIVDVDLQPDIAGPARRVVQRQRRRVERGTGSQLREKFPSGRGIADRLIQRAEQLRLGWPGISLPVFFAPRKGGGTYRKLDHLRLLK